MNSPKDFCERDCANSVQGDSPIFAETKIGTVPSDGTVPSELSELLGLLVDEQLTDAGRVRLAELLRDDKAARDFYLDSMQIHARLAWKQMLPSAKSDEADDVAPIAVDTLSIDDTFRAGPSLTDSCLFSYAIAAALMGGVLSVFSG
jgi:hypothetical protein